LIDGWMSAGVRLKDKLSCVELRDKTEKSDTIQGIFARKYVWKN